MVFAWVFLDYSSTFNHYSEANRTDRKVEGLVAEGGGMGGFIALLWYGCIAMRMVYSHAMRTRDGAMVGWAKGLILALAV